MNNNFNIPYTPIESFNHQRLIKIKKIYKIKGIRKLKNFQAIKYEKTEHNEETQRYISNVSEPWFSLIKKGIKTVEGRLNKGKFSKMKVGDIVEWNNKNKKFITRITAIRHYKTFEDMIKTEGLDKVLPYHKIETVKQGVNMVYYQFYSKEDETKYGVIAIEVSVLR